MADARTKQQLINRRTTLVASLGRTELFIENYVPERDRGQVKLRLDNLDTVWMGLDDVQTQLEDLETTNEGMAQNLHYRSHNETRYFTMKAALQSYLPIVPASASAMPQPASFGLSGIKLPTITLPEFDGDYNQWLAFHDTLVALIHSNPEVHDVQKFHYLRAALKGEAAQLVESIGISSSNYTIAWQTLVSRYANDYLLKKRHLQALLDCPRMKKESASALHSLVDEYERHTKTLRQLGEPIDSWSTILEHLLCLRLDDVTLKAWEDFAATAENPDYRCLIEFLQRRLRVLESMSVNHQAQSVTNPHPPMIHRPPFHSTVSYAGMEFRPRTCYACDEYHHLFECPRFESMSLPDRLRLVNEHRLCYNCFRQNHIARYCQSKFSCRQCKNRHHSLLHPSYHPSDDDQQPTTSHIVAYPSKHFEKQHPAATAINQQTSTSDAVATQSSKSFQLSNANVLLSTVVLLAYDCDGKLHPVRALLDNGSQSNIISERLCQLLRLQQNKVSIPVFGVGESSCSVKHSVRTTIRSRKCDYENTLDFLVMPRITIDLPVVSTPADDWHVPQHLFLADPNFNETGAIDLLLGAEHFFTFINPGTRIQKAECPVLIDIIFGWIVTGRNQLPQKHLPMACNVTLTDPFRTADDPLVETENQPNFSVEQRQCGFPQAYIVSRTPEPYHEKPIKELEVSPVPEFNQLKLDSSPASELTMEGSTHSCIAKSKHTDQLSNTTPVVILAKMILRPFLWLYTFLSSATAKLHSFAGAYDACIFARSSNPGHNVQSQQNTSVSKSPTLKRSSIPQLVILRCLRLAPHSWNTFATNLVSELQTTVPKSPHHGSMRLRHPDEDSHVAAQHQKAPEDGGGDPNKSCESALFCTSSSYSQVRTAVVAVNRRQKSNNTTYETISSITLDEMETVRKNCSTSRRYCKVAAV